jgi:hypothetical protein
MMHNVRALPQVWNSMLVLAGRKAQLKKRIFA